jgi:vitamin K-dependent gamma-carboxylase
MIGAECATTVCRRLFAPVDVSSLAAFRILFGGLMFWKIGYFISQGGVESEYLAPPIHFTYLGFGWVRAWPDAGMHAHFLVLSLLAACVMLGLFYRIAAGLFFAAYTYTFLLEKAYYLNHEYLICLISLLLAVVPAHRLWSLDALIQPRTRSETAPLWSLWLLRFQVAVPYIYGGIAKLDRDWLTGAPVRLGLRERLETPFVGGSLEHEAVIWGVVYGGLLLDLLVVPFLLWRRTRVAAFLAAALFHVTNAVLFDIGVFPWLMIAATSLFFSPDWPRKLLRWIPETTVPEREAATLHPVSTSQRVTSLFLLFYVIVQLTFPLRNHLYPGNPGWTGEGDFFAWRMMLYHKRGDVAFYAMNPQNHQRIPIDVRPMLTRFQYRRLLQDPDLIVQMSHVLAARMRDGGFGDFAVHVVALASLNGRRPQLLIDPEVDLSKSQRSLRHKRFYLPLTEPLSESSWDVPVREWPQHLPLPWSLDANEPANKPIAPPENST